MSVGLRPLMEEGRKSALAGQENCTMAHSAVKKQQGTVAGHHHGSLDWSSGECRCWVFLPAADAECVTPAGHKQHELEADVHGGTYLR